MCHVLRFILYHVCKINLIYHDNRISRDDISGSIVFSFRMKIQILLLSLEQRSESFFKNSRNETKTDFIVFRPKIFRSHIPLIIIV